LLHRHYDCEFLEHWHGMTGKSSQAAIYLRNERFQRAINQVDLAAATAVVGYDTSSWLLTDRCRSLSVPLLLNQTTWHAKAKVSIINRLKEEFPEWIEEVVERLPQMLVAEEKELREASLVVTCSSAARNSLIENGVPGNKVHINPYGIDSSMFSPAQRSNGRRFRFLFVGNVSAFKGVPLLIQAWQRLSPRSADLWLVGSAPPRLVANLPKLDGLSYLGKINHDDLPSIMRECSVLVFPSYYEGFGVVILEAMASGLPVITTTATGGADTITHGKDGWIMEPGNVEQLATAMNECLSNPKRIEDMSYEARVSATRFTWAKHAQRYLELVSSLHNPNCPAT
jgi:glycosyltransferase involved in cell wall biosynthesis